MLELLRRCLVEGKEGEGVEYIGNRSMTLSGHRNT